MKILRIHVENFGRLSGLDLDLSAGLNEVLEENGWGKSTLAAFIRTMFYGLEGERKRDLSENDRMKYKPWNQKSFGGSVEFEAGGKRYVVTRNYGEKDKDATFRLQDAETLLDSKDYSERLGEELFGIDRESYERTSFIDRADVKYHGINSTIGSKVGSVAQTDDLNNYDAAQEKMKNFLNANSPKKKTGELYKLWDEIMQLDRDAGNQGLVEARIEGVREVRDKEKEKLGSITAEREVLQKERASLAENRTKALNVKRKDELEEQLRLRKQGLQEIRARFGDRIPKREELRALSECVDEAQRHHASLAGFERLAENDRYERLKKYFRNGVPEEEAVLTQIENCNALQDGILRKGHLEEQAEGERQKLEEYALELQKLEVQASLLAEKKKKERLRLRMAAMALLAAGLLLGIMTAALSLSALLWIPAGLLILTGGVLMAAPWIRGMAKECVPSGESELIRHKEQIARENLEALRADVKEQEDFLREKEREVKAFLERNGITYSRADAEEMLYEIKNRAAEYRELCREEEEKARSRQSLLELEAKGKAKIDGTLREMGLSMDGNDHAGIRQWIGESLQSLTIYEKELGEEEAAKKALESFCEEHPEVSWRGGEVLSEEEIKAREEALELREKELAEQESKAHETISAYNRSLDEAYENAEELRGKKEKLEQLKERHEQEMGRYRLVEKTQEYLKTAKERFTARFMEPIKTAFDKYYELMAGNGADEYQIDANVNVFRKEEGQYRNVEAQSEGYADVIGLCIRMALLDAMYEKEKPLVIMDDPFASLDEKHLEGAKRFLRVIAKDYQILYLTCHEMRSCK